MSATIPSSIPYSSSSIDIASASFLAYEDINIYGMTPSFGGNLSLAIVMGILFLLHSILGFYFKQAYFGIAFFCGCGLEFAGYIGRTLSHSDPGNVDYFLLQIIALTMAPAFIMAGIYYLLAKLVVIYGDYYSIFKPIVYSYVFIFCDLISLVLQGAGGGMAAVALKADNTDEHSADAGNNIMLAGLIFQVVSMSFFLFFWLEFKNSSFFKKFSKIIDLSSKDHLFNPNPNYVKIRQNNKFLKYFPIVLTLSVIFIYIRCFYRVFELAEGWRGELILNETYIFILDSLMMGLGIAILLLPFYPGYLLRSRNIDITVGFKIHWTDLKFIKKDVNKFLSEIKENQIKPTNFDLNSKADDEKYLNSKNDNFNSITLNDSVSANINASPKSQTNIV
ncbi:RTA1 domain-containing protein [Ascoidea rubescens DSM 1968]|uniref:Sphingoid long-chain base transporter RSB1 n=1 Tax=Ascoidea rubescens DSM 1968 TaxID=1344418 RepID=A0A1D2VI16_9ASCO|nr:RTA1-domain-containing protein [Ascoidea rubescens DSM 1968]ODV61123.1 RTA1-domain-containing protein [Ascoidea rubescens DSM 1968]